jgi:hypothetical protein
MFSKWFWINGVGYGRKGVGGFIKDIGVSL